MYLQGARRQDARDHIYDASGTLATGGTAQLLLPEAKSRSLFIFSNLSSSALFLEFGGARATCTLSGGTISSFTITNAGFNYTLAPIVELFGGGPSGNTLFIGVGQPGYPAPGDEQAVFQANMSAQRPASVTAVIAANAVSSFIINDPGAGYEVAPYVFLRSRETDPGGVAIPSSTSGIYIAPTTSANPPFILNGTACPTDAIAVAGTSAQSFSCKWMP